LAAAAAAAGLGFSPGRGRGAGARLKASSWQPRGRSPARPWRTQLSAGSEEDFAASLAGATSPRQRLEIAEQLEKRLNDIIERAKESERELEKVVAGSAGVLPQVPPPRMTANNPADLQAGLPRRVKPRRNEDGSRRMDSWDDLGELSSGWLKGREDSRGWVLDKNTPILSLDPAGRLVGLYSADLSASLPGRVYPVQLTGGCVDEGSGQDAASRQRLEDLAESMEPLWMSAEAAVDAVAMAEQRLNEKRPKRIADFRERVVQGMIFAQTQDEDYDDKSPVSREDMEAVLDIIVRDKGLRNALLPRLEEYVLELEGCRNELVQKEKDAATLRGKSDGYAKFSSQLESLQERLIRVTFDIRTICQTAQDSVEMKAAFKSIGDTLAGLNPFR